MDQESIYYSFVNDTIKCSFIYWLDCGGRKYLVCPDNGDTYLCTMCGTYSFVVVDTGFFCCINYVAWISFISSTLNDSIFAYLSRGLVEIVCDNLACKQPNVSVRTANGAWLLQTPNGACGQCV